MVRSGSFNCLFFIFFLSKGDTAFNLATSVGGKVVAFEMGPTYQMLEQNIR